MISSNTIKPEYYVEKGNYQYSIGNIKKAKLFYKKAIDLDEKFFSAYFNLAILLQKEKKFQEAIIEYKNSLRINPDYFGIYINLSNCYGDIGDNISAIKILQAGLKKKPNYEIIYNLSLIHKKIGNIDRANYYCLKALHLEPNSKKVLRLSGNILTKKNLIDDALKSYYKSLSLNNKSSNDFESLLLTDIAECHLLNGEVDKAILFLQKAKKMDQNNIDSYHLLSSAYKSIGNFSKAIEYFKIALKKDPSKVTFFYNVLDILDEPIEEKYVIDLKKTFKDNSKSLDNRMYAGFILNFIFERKKDYKSAFNFLKEANRIKRNQINYNFKDDKVYVNNIIDVFNKKIVNYDPKKTCKSNLPIFIVGMPRSGSTLIEQIISSHSKVHGSGEVNYFANSLTEIINSKKDRKIYPDVANFFLANDFKTLGDLYEKKIKGSKKKYFKITDKGLLNFFYIGLIHLSLPHAKIIHCKRNPLDTCLSCFKRDFVGAYRFTYDLNELINFYKLYEKLMVFWHKLFPKAILDVQYENLVNNFTLEAKKILNFCNLSWEKNCEEFYNSKRIILTSSDSQVRKPIYKSSIDSWKKYKSFLEPLKKILEKNN